MNDPYKTPEGEEKQKNLLPKNTPERLVCIVGVVLFLCFVYWDFFVANQNPIKPISGGLATLLALSGGGIAIYKIWTTDWLGKY